MAAFPRIITIVRRGVPEPIVVPDAETLLSVRTELELLHQFSQHATPDVLEALIQRRNDLDHTEFLGRAKLKCDLEEMQAILSDGLQQDNKQSRQVIDRDYPEVARRIDSHTIEEDARAFRRDVALQIEHSSDTNVQALSAVFQKGDTPMPD